MIFSTLLTCLAVAPAAVWAGMYGQPVINLDAKTFKSVMATEHAAMVAFVAPWCGHYKNMAPEYTSAAQSLSPLIPFYAVDCDASQNKGLCAEYRIEGFPTVKAFPRAGKGAARDYNGERKKGAFVDFAKTLVPDRVKKLRVDDGVESLLRKFLGEKPKLPHALLIHPSTPSIPFLWKVLGHRLSSKLHLGYIRDGKSHEVLSSLGLYDATETTRDTARAVFWPAGGDTAQVVEYDGELKFNALLSWLQAHADGKDTPQDSKKQKPIKATDGSEAARQAKLDQAEKRERARREKQGEQSGTSNVEAAPDAQPGESVSEDSATGASDQTSGGAPEPVPGSDTVLDVSDQGRVEILHEEL